MAFFSFALQLIFQFVKRPQVPALVFVDPPFPNGVDGNGIQVMLFVAPAPERRHQIGAFQNAQMLAHRLARHLLTRAQSVQALSVFSKKPVQKLAAFSMSQSLEDRIGVHKGK